MLIYRPLDSEPSELRIRARQCASAREIIVVALEKIPHQDAGRNRIILKPAPQIIH